MQALVPRHAADIDVLIDQLIEFRKPGNRLDRTKAAMLLPPPVYAEIRDHGCQPGAKPRRSFGTITVQPLETVVAELSAGMEEAVHDLSVVAFISPDNVHD